MAWRDDLLPASFRGIPFEVLVTDGQLGRRAALHEYPGRDKPWVEDLGRRARVLTLDAVVVGADWKVRRDRLIGVFEEAGAGQLVHPTLGEMRVTLVDCRLGESTAEGGMARFSLAFVEAGDATWPKAAPLTPDLVAAKAEPVLGAAQGAFEGGFSAAGRPDFVADSAGAMLLSLVAGVQAAAGAIAVDDDGLAQLSLQADTITAGPAQLAYDPAGMGQQSIGLVQQLTRETATTPADALASAQSLFAFGTLSVATSGKSPQRVAELNNQVEFARLVRAAAIAEAARAAALLEFDSFDQAAALRQQLVDAIDDLLMATTDDAVFDALRALRAAIVRDITERGADLSRLVRFEPKGTAPALVLAQMLYADGARADEILARNPEVAHPLLVPGGRELEVLADA